MYHVIVGLAALGIGLVVLAALLKYLAADAPARGRRSGSWRGFEPGPPCVLDPAPPLVGDEVSEELRPEGRRVCRVQLGDGGLLVPIPTGLEPAPDVPDRDQGRILHPGDRAVVAAPGGGPDYVLWYSTAICWLTFGPTGGMSRASGTRSEAAKSIEIFASRGDRRGPSSVQDGAFAAGRRACG